MKILKRKMGTRVSILCAGATFDERRYGLEGVVQNLGILDYEETAALYRTCDIGLVMMMTRHPSYLPFELMACGTLVISNYNQVNSWLLKHEENCLLVKPNSMTIAEQLEHAVLNFEQYNEVRKRGHDMIHEGYTNWERSFLPVVEFIDHLSAGRL
jgi:glycosyltransferase involved in cell wall biosynthesis